MAAMLASETNNASVIQFTMLLVFSVRPSSFIWFLCTFIRIIFYKMKSCKAAVRIYLFVQPEIYVLISQNPEMSATGLWNWR